MRAEDARVVEVDLLREKPLLIVDPDRDVVLDERRSEDDAAAEADLVIDTSGLNVHELRNKIIGFFGNDTGESSLRATVVSFGYKYGLPVDADLVVDCRFLPNPHWIDELRPLTGLDPAVRDYVMEQEASQAFVDQLDQLLAMLLPAYVAEGKSYLAVALGCTGGRHRSVAIAEQVASLLRRRGYSPGVVHRDVEKAA